jgi:metal-responsive CopG/Arc/MetJ family transcriptional regulator
MQNSISVGISLPKKIMSQIDAERGDVSRSRFLLRKIEGTYSVQERALANAELKVFGISIEEPLGKIPISSRPLDQEEI